MSWWAGSELLIIRVVLLGVLGRLWGVVFLIVVFGVFVYTLIKLFYMFLINSLINVFVVLCCFLFDCVVV